MNAMDAALICRALGDSNRIRIVELLIHGEMCGCRLLEHFQISQPTLSHHMKILTECGLVKGRKEWKNTYYSLDCSTLTAFREYIDHLNCGKPAEDGRCCGAKKQRQRRGRDSGSLLRRGETADHCCGAEETADHCSGAGETADHCSSRGTDNS
jgi:ArsR family transcriptional regulator